ncbi:transmembrane and coiled-coil domain-containing protein 6 [Callorhinchus milii]|uniref:transmembrane and coiled-coil domain-containing protein 6 n=1 Tax=Callorhinchus milii TaxID=7868 RepID=UPI001C3FE314|nr:transmembrane and coiled-coil domain-containing protein 6 [Callorhinchus milii]
MLRGRGRYRAHSIEAFKCRRREQEQTLRKARKEKQLVSKRLLRDVWEDGDRMETAESPLTREEVLQLHQRIQLGTEDRLVALRCLRRALQQKEVQQTFLSLDSSLHVLVGLFTSNLASVQLEAAGCLLELSHSDDPSISLLCLPATPYLLTYLSGRSVRFTELCLYILGNLAAENAAVRRQLMAQGVIHALATCLQSSEGAVVEAAAYSLSQLLQGKESAHNIVPAELVAKVIPLLLQLLVADSQCGVWAAVESAWCLHYIISSGAISEHLVSQDIVSRAVTLLIALGKPGSATPPDTVHLLIIPVVRCLGNLIAGEETNQCKAQIQQSDLLPTLGLFITSFLHTQPFVARECLWLFNNLTAGDALFCSAVLGLNLVPMFLRLIPFSGGINTQALLVLGNVAELGPETCQRLYQADVTPALCCALRMADVEVVRLALEVLNMIFLHCPEAYVEFVKQDGVQAVEAIQYNANEEIRVRAHFLMDKYFTQQSEGS